MYKCGNCKKEIVGREYSVSGNILVFCQVCWDASETEKEEKIR